MPRTRRMTRATSGQEDAIPSASSAPEPESEPQSSSETMPFSGFSLRPKHIRSLKKRKVPLDLRCQWLLCSFASDSMQDFNNHVATHVPVSLDPGNTYERCHWADCTFQTSDQREMKRHVLFHGVHAKLMAIGTNLAADYDLKRCRLDPRDRHVMPELKEPFICQWEDCTVELDDPQSFYWHVEHHLICHYKGEKISKAKPAKCLWDDCTVQMATMHMLQAHVRRHTRERQIACPDCGAVFGAAQTLLGHTRRQLPFEELRFQCSHCLRLYATERMLRSHIRGHINTHRCEECGLTFPNKASVEAHIVCRHTEERNFPCPKCDKRFKTQQFLDVHLRMHEVREKGERHLCPHPGCRYVFLHPDRLKKHYDKKHSGEPRRLYVCHLCDARYLNAGSMASHLRSFHNLDVPAGHSRFRYKRDADGHFRLQTLRYESLEVAGQDLEANEQNLEADEEVLDADDPLALDQTDLEEAETGSQSGQAAPPPQTRPTAALSVPDVLALSCQADDVPDTITTDDGRELHLPEQVRRALSTGRKVLVCVLGDQVQLLARMDAVDELRNPDDPDSLMMVVDGQAVADGPAATAGH